MLGTGTPRADPERSGPSLAVVTGGEAYLVDCGTGVVRRASAAAARGIPELIPRRLRRVFITHLHSDHTLGYPDLILTPWVLGREVPMQAWGPPGLKAMTDNLLDAYAEDVRVRIRGLEADPAEGVRVIAAEVAPGEVYRDQNVTVTAFAVRHGSWPVAYGYRFEAKDRTIVVSGDTAATEVVAEQCRGCDVLVHEAYAVDGFGELPDDWRAYHSSFHTSTAELARIAARARPKLLVIYHQLAWGGRDAAALADEVGTLYDGAVVSASDLDVF